MSRFAEALGQPNNQDTKSNTNTPPPVVVKLSAITERPRTSQTAEQTSVSASSIPSAAMTTLSSISQLVEEYKHLQQRYAKRMVLQRDNTFIAASDSSDRDCLAEIIREDERRITTLKTTLKSKVVELEGRLLVKRQLLQVLEGSTMSIREMQHIACLKDAIQELQSQWELCKSFASAD